MNGIKNIVTVGGGTGSYTVLSGLKRLKNVSLSAVVSMADDGSSTGVLRDELGVLPPGDVRQCLVALSEHSDIVRKLINYRFDEGALSGHSFGNILLAALEKVTGDFATGVEIASEILKVRGTVIPITRDKAELSALLSDGTLVEGEVNVDEANFHDLGLEKIFYKNEVKINKDAEKAILEADFILIGPGNYYCSVIPNLIVEGFKEAVSKSKAKIIFPVNLTNKKEHTKNWKLSDYVENTEKYLGKPIDIILVNTESPSEEQIKRYELEEGDGVLVEDDMDDERIVRKPLISHSFFTYSQADAKRNVRSFIRHDSDKLAESISDIIQEK
ncbi:MAG TPA: gluconeogenesis factor YvcK family protein [Flavobacterium sp.]|nr:gluconeogenesis factor YvcK family protein [Flavobacterium sp.]